MDNRDKFYFFNKVLLSWVPVLFTLYSNYLSEPDKRPKGSDTAKHCAQLRLVYTSDTNTSTSFIKCGRYSARINTNTGESTHSFFLFSPVINAFKEQVQKNKRVRFILLVFVLKLRELVTRTWIMSVFLLSMFLLMLILLMISPHSVVVFRLCLCSCRLYILVLKLHHFPAKWLLHKML